MGEFPAVMPHGDLEVVFPEIWMVSGTSRPSMMGTTFQFSRNMFVVREGNALTLVQTLRLDDAGLATLEALGKVTNIVRLGAFHGMDDAFYQERYGATLWSVPGVKDEHGANIERALEAGQPTPLQNASIFTFETAKLPEALLLLERDGGILFSCDALQNWTEADRYFDQPSTELMTKAGFFKTANVGPGWRGAAEPKAEDFARLRKLPFRHLLPCHGRPILNDAPARLETTFTELGL